MVPNWIEFTVRRLLASALVLIFISVVTFLLLDVLPGNTAQRLLGPDATPIAIASLQAELGLDRPIWQRFYDWAFNLLRGDFGVSIGSRQPNRDLIFDRLPVTAELVALSLSLATILALLATFLGARESDGIIKRGVLLFSAALVSTPVYVLALFLVLLFAVTWAVLPSLGFVPLTDGLVDHLKTMILPTAALALPLCGLYATFLHNDVVEQLTTEDYVWTARTKGLAESQVVIRHVLRNSVLGLFTLVALHFGSLIGGTVLVEQIFGLPGIGQLLLQATNTQDYELVGAIVLILTAITVVANLSVELLCSFVDPRIRFGDPV